MRRKPAALVAVVLLFSLATGGCALIGPQDPDDFRLASVAAVDSEALTEYPWSSNLFRLVANEKLLRIEFTTKFNLIYESFGRGYNIWNRIDFCQDNADVYGSGVSWNSHVYWHGIAIDRQDEYATNAELLKIYDSQTIRTFYAYLPVSYYQEPNVSHVGGEPPPLLYNLKRKPENVCLRVGGAVMFGPSFRSNVVFTPKEVIANVLAATH